MSYPYGIVVGTHHLVLATAPIHRDSPNESVTIDDPIMRLRRMLSTRASAWWFSVIGKALPPFTGHSITLVSLVEVGEERKHQRVTANICSPDVCDS